MKRLRCNVHGLSRGKLYGQSQVHESGLRRRGGGSCIDGKLELTMNDAFSYLEEVKNTFSNQREKYSMFLVVLNDFKRKRIDIDGVITKVKELFKGHSNLLLGLNRFLPKGYEIILNDEEVKKIDGKLELTMNDAFSYLKEVKNSFSDQREKYNMFLVVLNDFKRKRSDIDGVITRVKELFKGHSNLLPGLNLFLPEGYEIIFNDEEKKEIDSEQALNLIKKIKKRLRNDREYKSFLDILIMCKKENKEVKEVHHEISVLLDGHPDLLDELTKFLSD